MSHIGQVVRGQAVTKVAATRASARETGIIVRGDGVAAAGAPSKAA